MKKKQEETPAENTISVDQIMDSTGVLAHKMASAAGEVIRARDGYANVADAVLPKLPTKSVEVPVKRKPGRPPKITKVKQAMFSITVFVNGTASTAFSYSADVAPTVTTTVEKL